jgi:hypothetical protein
MSQSLLLQTTSTLFTGFTSAIRRFPPGPPATGTQGQEEDIQIIRYESVRDPASAGCAAVLSHVTFTEPVPIENQTWTLAVFKHHVVWRQNSIFENDTFEFNADRWLL